MRRKARGSLVMREEGLIVSTDGPKREDTHPEKS